MLFVTTSQPRYVDFVYSEVNFEDVYAGCAKMAELDVSLAEYGLKRVAVVDTGAGWGDAFYSRNSHHGLKAWICFCHPYAFPRRVGRGTKYVIKRLSQLFR